MSIQRSLKHKSKETKRKKRGARLIITPDNKGGFKFLPTDGKEMGLTFQEEGLRAIERKHFDSGGLECVNE